jgi:hypothetical protein
MLPPGRARLVTIPVATGSIEATKTTGIERVASRAAGTGGVPDARMTSTLRRTSLAAASGRASVCRSPSRKVGGRGPLRNRPIRWPLDAGWPSPRRGAASVAIDPARSARRLTIDSLVAYST